MGVNNIDVRKEMGETIRAAHINEITNALIGALVGRASTGAPNDTTDLGTTTFPFNQALIKALNLQQVATEPNEVAGAILIYSRNNKLFLKLPDATVRELGSNEPRADLVQFDNRTDSPKEVASAALLYLKNNILTLREASGLERPIAFDTGTTRVIEGVTYWEPLPGDRLQTADNLDKTITIGQSQGSYVVFKSLDARDLAVTFTNFVASGRGYVEETNIRVLLNGSPVPCVIFFYGRQDQFAIGIGFPSSVTGLEGQVTWDASSSNITVLNSDGETILTEVADSNVIFSLNPIRLDGSQSGTLYYWTSGTLSHSDAATRIDALNLALDNGISLVSDSFAALGLSINFDTGPPLYRSDDVDELTYLLRHDGFIFFKDRKGNVVPLKAFDIEIAHLQIGNNIPLAVRSYADDIAGQKLFLRLNIKNTIALPDGDTITFKIYGTTADGSDLDATLATDALVDGTAIVNVALNAANIAEIDKATDAIRIQAFIGDTGFGEWALGIDSNYSPPFLSNEDFITGVISTTVERRAAMVSRLTQRLTMTTIEEFTTNIIPGEQYTFTIPAILFTSRIASGSVTQVPVDIGGFDGDRAIKSSNNNIPSSTGTSSSVETTAVSGSFTATSNRFTVRFTQRAPVGTNVNLSLRAGDMITLKGKFNIPILNT